MPKENLKKCWNSLGNGAQFGVLFASATLPVLAWIAATDGIKKKTPPPQEVVELDTFPPNPEP
jgi:hypothetical protein